MVIADCLGGAPISWGVCEAPGWGRRLDSATVHPHVGTTVETANDVERRLAGSGCEVSVGESIPLRSEEALLDKGIELGVVKQGPQGVPARTRDQRVGVEPFRVEVVNCLAPVTPFGGAHCHGLLAVGRWSELCGLPMLRGRSWPLGAGAQLPCLPTTRSNTAWAKSRQPTMRSWSRSTWPRNCCTEVRHE